MRDKKEIIETDLDTKEEDFSETGGLYPYDPSFEDIDLKEDPQSVFQYIRKYNQGKLIIDPDFQRNLVWEPIQKSQFIESVILNFPLPPFYLNQDKNGNLTIIDGLQRTTTLFQFFNDKFELSGLEAIPELNGSEFSTLSPELQAKIEDKKILLYILKPSTPLIVIYDLFKRINTGGTQLNRQEIRNCIFLGKATKLLKELSEKDYFKKAIDYGISPKRMKDREAVLRCIAFKIQNFETDYEGNMSGFVENAMRKINKMNGSEIDLIKKDFEKVMTYTFSFFGKNNFRIPTQHTRGTINIAVLESVSYFFFNQPDNFIEDNKPLIKNNYKRLISNQNYQNAVRFSTGSKAHVITRFKLVKPILAQGKL
ncbi:MAG: DUF262 domain-containing protein [Desulfobacteraceae bacterium]|nr:DUF262 domain-containing protein [Desulfobacteraceae bacterium]